MTVAELSEIKCASVPGVHGVARFLAKDSAVAEGCQFVRLDPRNTSLVNLVTMGNTNAPDPLPKYFSLTASHGLATLVRLRNGAQAQSLQETERKEGAQGLFDDVQPAKKRTVSHVSRAAQKAMKATRTALLLEFQFSNGQNCTVKVLRPIYSSENLWVEYSPESMGGVLVFLREQGFVDADEGKRLPKDDEVPKGIYKRTTKKNKLVRWLVILTADGQKTSRTFETLDDAKAFQAGEVCDRVVGEEEGQGAHEASIGGEQDESDGRSAGDSASEAVPQDAD